MSAQSGQLALPGTEMPGRDERAVKAAPADATGALLAGASVGLAMFDKDLRLLACNDTYRVLRGHQPGELVPGIHLQDLIRRVLERLELSDDQIATRVKAAMDRVVPGVEDTIRYVADFEPLSSNGIFYVEDRDGTWTDITRAQQ